MIVTVNIRFVDMEDLRNKIKKNKFLHLSTATTLTVMFLNYYFTIKVFHNETAMRCQQQRLF